MFAPVDSCCSHCWFEQGGLIRFRNWDFGFESDFDFDFGCMSSFDFEYSFVPDSAGCYKTERVHTFHVNRSWEEGSAEQACRFTDDKGFPFDYYILDMGLNFASFHDSDFDSSDCSDTSAVGHNSDDFLACFDHCYTDYTGRSADNFGSVLDIDFVHTFHYDLVQYSNSFRHAHHLNQNVKYRSILNVDFQKQLDFTFFA